MCWPRLCGLLACEDEKEATLWCHTVYWMFMVNEKRQQIDKFVPFGQVSNREKKERERETQRWKTMRDTSILTVIFGSKRAINHLVRFVVIFVDRSIISIARFTLLKSLSIRFACVHTKHSIQFSHIIFFSRNPMIFR